MQKINASFAKMSIFEIVLLGLALAMDAFAVAVCIAASSDSLKIKHVLNLAIFFGGFQSMMPYLGWRMGTFAHQYIQTFDHWIAFALLSYIGIRMIHESYKCRRCETEKRMYGDPGNVYVLFTLALATSIDALAVGVGMGCQNQEILLPITLIGIITFAMTILGAFLGAKISKWTEGKIEILGGLILIGIGIKILIQGVFFD